MYSKVYVEITNICNKSCSFCPKTRRVPRLMSEAEFSSLAFNQDVSFTKIFAFAAVGFLIYSALSMLLPKYHADSYFLIVPATLSSLVWVGNYSVADRKVFFGEIVENVVIFEL